MKRDISGRWLKIQQRFGIAAPRVAVYSHTPWHWRWLWLVVLVTISAVAAKWVYDAGRRFVGFDQSEVQSELDRYWDLLRQRRALREFGRDASEARERDADTVKKYLG